jgi:hypothetical protein
MVFLVRLAITAVVWVVGCYLSQSIIVGLAIMVFGISWTVDGMK